MTDAPVRASEERRRFTVQYGSYPGDKGYVVVEGEPMYSADRKVVFTTDSKSDAADKADHLNEVRRD